MIVLYNVFLALYSLGVRIISLGNAKAKLWLKGRQTLLQQIQSTYQPGNSQKVWMHCASLGEFEQGRPVLKKLTETYPGLSVVITFFSPSGYEIAKNNKDFTQVYYLPVDSRSNAEKLLDILQPDLVLWIKYEYWHYYLQEMKKRNIPLLLVSAVYQPQQVFFKWYGTFYRNMLKCFTHFFVQNINSKNELTKLVNEGHITVSGDTRCDRVINIAENFTDILPVKNFCGNEIVVVAGSTWEDDEVEWTHFVKQHPHIKFIIAPHEIDEENLNDVKKEFIGVFYSEWIKIPETSGNEQTKINCLIIDNIGMLSGLYKYATITYIGGGFGYNGLHNVLEAAVYGKPVIFGPEYDKNFEAEELIDCSGGISIRSALELEKIVSHLLENPDELTSRGNAAREYVYRNAGASKKIVDYIQANLLLTS